MLNDISVGQLFGYSANDVNPCNILAATFKYVCLLLHKIGTADFSNGDPKELLIQKVCEFTPDFVYEGLNKSGEVRNIVFYFLCFVFSYFYVS